MVSLKVSGYLLIVSAVGRPSMVNLIGLFSSAIQVTFSLRAARSSIGRRDQKNDASLRSSPAVRRLRGK
jgi:hypothetical protein